VIEIPEIINQEEVILRYLFSNNLKKSNKLGEFKETLNRDLLKGPYIFFDSRGEVSLQRKDYLSEEKCRETGESNSLDLVGYIKFFAKEYFNLIDEHRLEPGREEFEANLLWSPLDSEGLNRDDRPVYTTDSGLPAHCGINYIKPAPVVNEEPNTAIRMFSHKLFKICTLELVS
jgi:hypothetical protein